MCRMRVWRSEDRFGESDSTIHHVGSKDGTLVTRLGSGCPQSPSHLVVPLSFFSFLDRISFCIHCAPQAVLELLILLLIPRA